MPEMIQFTRELAPDYKLSTQYGHITVREWLEKEKARFERKPYPGEKSYQKRTAEIRKVGKDIALFVDDVL